MDEMAASSSRSRVAWALSFSALRFSTGAGFSVGLGGIDFSGSFGLVIMGRAALVNGSFEVFAAGGMAPRDAVSIRSAGVAAGPVEVWFRFDSVFIVFIMRPL